MSTDATGARADTATAAAPDEAAALLGLADTLFPPAPDGRRAGPTRGWRERVLASAGEQGPEAEEEMSRAEAELRAMWLRHAHGFTDPLYKSPPLGTPMALPFGRPSTHSYERNIECPSLEERLAAQDTGLDHHEAAHVVYSSGMASIAGVLQCYRSLTRATADGPLNLVMWGAYYETGVLFDLVADDGLRCRRAESQEELRSSLLSGEVDVLFVEPVRYEWELEALDLPALMGAWRERRGGRPGMVVVDSTLVAPVWPMERFAEAVGDPGVLVVEVRSGLKLDQRGLELGNLGVASLYTRRSDPVLPPVADLAAYLRKMRTVVGSGLSLEALSVLSAPFVLDRAAARDHAVAVLRNNALTARLLADLSGPGRLFSRIAHPALDGGAAWAQAPFVVCHLREDRLEHHGRLLGVLRSQACRRGLPFSHGSSFGFRAHRFECIVPSLKEGRGLFKVAMGARGGWGRSAVLELLMEVASHPDIDSLCRSDPDAVPVDLTDLE
ncbi:hypothetical protein IDM40_20530 [Nocardiopsis sp. HNM0947]|uniref:Aminotransferase class I/classII domain-containing protein n=1 Tax=Nocardiopsis coralli TaxID=2772213 RepID=A0ABR9PB55_9ACTN|nr:hypothetical protein [Nocardiopsis coralli]MBE3001059.1 hypothetical protein [Nocardiopsis coralli]